MPSVRRTLAEMTLIKLSDDTLSDTPEALLSRLAELERKASEGAPVQPVPDVSGGGDFSKPVVLTDESDKPDGKCRDEVPFDRWEEAVSHVIDSEPLYGSHLRNTSASICGDEFRVRMSDFAYSILNREEVRAAVAYAVRETGFENCRKDKVKFIKSGTGKSPAADILDGLI